MIGTKSYLRRSCVTSVSALRIKQANHTRHADFLQSRRHNFQKQEQSIKSLPSTTMSSKDSTNSMIASDYKEPHDLPSLPAGLSADSLLVSALTEGTRKSSMRDLSASRFGGGGDTSGLPRSPTKSVVINLPEEPPSKRMRTHTNAAPIDVVVSGMCLSFSSTYRAKSPLPRKNDDVNDTSQEQEPLQRISCLKERPNLLRGPTSTFTLHRYH